MNLESQVRNLFGVVLAEIRDNPRFAERVRGALGNSINTTPRRTGRRPPGPLDPFAVFVAEGESGLRARLEDLSVEELKNVVAEHGMDSSKLAMKWKTADRLVDLVVERVRHRSSKGDAFRAPQPDIPR